MIDINFILENKEYVKEALKKKLYEADIDGLCSMVIEKRNLQKKVEENQAKQNKLSKSVPMVKKEGGDVASIFATVKELANENKIAEEKLKTLTDQINNVVNAYLIFLIKIFLVVEKKIIHLFIIIWTNQISNSLLNPTSI